MEAERMLALAFILLGWRGEGLRGANLRQANPPEFAMIPGWRTGAEHRPLTRSAPGLVLAQR